MINLNRIVCLLRKMLQWIVCAWLGAGVAFGQPAGKTPVAAARCFVGSSAFMLGNLSSNPPSFYQFNFGYRISAKDVISFEALTWSNDAPNGIPYGPSFGAKSENYPGRAREYGIGVVYQRFLWSGLYASLQLLPLKRIYLDESDNKIQSGFRLFSTLRIGYHIPLFKNRIFIEPSLAGTFWPINTNVPPAFAEKDNKWKNYFLFEPGLHFGINF
jgi:hypothetical protein